MHTPKSNLLAFHGRRAAVRHYVVHLPATVHIYSSQEHPNDHVRTENGSPFLPNGYKPLSGQLPAPCRYGEEQLSTRYRYVAPSKAISFHPESACV